MYGDGDETINLMQHMSTKEIKDDEWLGRTGDLRGIVQEIRFELNDIRTNQNMSKKMKPTKIVWDFEIQTDHSVTVSWPDLMLIKKKELDIT